jgi:hypothetical protein
MQREEMAGKDLRRQVLRFKTLDFNRESLRRGMYNQVPIEDLPLAGTEGDPGRTVPDGQATTRTDTMKRWKCAVEPARPLPL